MIIDINLLPKTAKQKADVGLPLIVLGVFSILLLVFFGFQYFSARSELADFSTQQASLQTELDTLQMQYNVLTNVTQGSLEESVTFVERVSYAVSPLIDETQNLLPGHTYLRSYSFSEDAVTIAVDFETLSDVADYVIALEKSGYFSDAQLSSVSNFELNPVASVTETEKAVEDEKAKFNEIPRYSTDITLAIDSTYLAAGGDTE